MKQIIINAPVDKARKALDALLENVKFLDEAFVPDGHGWGVGSGGDKFFVRRTKSGYSIQLLQPPRMAGKRACDE